MRKYLLISLSLFIGQANAETLRAITSNIESASDKEVLKVAETIRKLGKAHLWALQEVESEVAVQELTYAAENKAGWDRYRYIISESGQYNQMSRKDDYLALIYNSSDLRQVETVELHGVRSKPETGRLREPDWRARGAFFLRLQHKDTGIELYFGTVHLKCCDAGIGQLAHQTKVLADWIEQSDVPVIIAGDFNIPIEPSEVDSFTPSAAFANMDAVSDWVKPNNPVTTQCDDRFSSILDHVFVKPGSNIAVPAGVEILEDQADFCDFEEQGYADHRPVQAMIELEE